MTVFAAATSLADRVDRVARRMGTAPALICAETGAATEPETVIGFDRFCGGIRRRAKALYGLGLRRGDVIAMMMPHTLVSLETLLAGMIAATAQTLNYMLEVEALIALIRASGATALAAAPEFADDPRAPEKVAAIREALPHLRLIVFGQGPRPAGSVDLDALADTQSDAGWPDGVLAPDPGHVAALFHTSGTTGLPKLVPQTEAMWLAALEACANAQGNAPSEIMLGGLPLYHTSGAVQTGGVPLLTGTCVVIPSLRGFRDPAVIANFWNLIERHRVTICAMVPTISAAVAANPPARRPTTLRTIVSGGAPLPAQLFQTLEEISGAQLLDGWGMTETCGFSVMNPPGAARFGTVGVAFEGVEVETRRLDAGGALTVPCAPDEIGELVVRGPIVIKSYFDSRPSAFTPDGWLRTGDLARIDRDGYVSVTGRAKDLIIRSGHNIDPGTIEEPAYQHPAVQLAVAVGRPDRHAGELPVLYIQLKPGAQATPEEIADFVRARVLERAAAPKSVHILAEIPLTGTGKVSKLKLRHDCVRDHFQDEIDTAIGTPGVVAVSVDDHARHGTFVTLARTAGAGDGAVAAAEAVMQGYALQYGWA